ncbi:DoxX family protein [Saccharothrix variisporea]|uniref:Putative membrane protein YphA (DoxX/SURF4 family) n=1 Tax=Saccharothrix variisporea TaxID=543527 RepID=A0A495X6K8_9PSEU|nr:DoxX family protein [Saccharothrix variisporea]RKT68664.1 putative membrane protein YphA (DoxX/SURF4 family) [Saccharothrix variisporea]
MSATKDFSLETVPPRRWDRFEGVLRQVAPTALRGSIGLLFVWFGLLKVAGQSPVADLVSATLPWVPRGFLLPALGAVEVVLGVALLVGKPRRATLVVTAAHLLGTFLVFVQAPALAWSDGNPLLLTATGEFVLKNLVLVCAVLLLLGSRRRS